MADSGAATSVGCGVLRLTGEKHRLSIIVAIVAIAAILTYGGVSLFVVIFAVFPLARPIFQRLDIPWPIFAVGSKEGGKLRSDWFTGAPVVLAV